MIQIRKITQPTYSFSQQEIRHNNTMMVFNMIRDMAPISRVELSRNCILSVSTVSNLVEDLIKDKWIVEKESVAANARGRHSIMLSVNHNMGYVATVELLSMGYICTIYNIGLERISGIRIKNVMYDADHIAHTINTLLKSAKVDPAALLGVHLVFPGIVDPVSGDLISSTAFDDVDKLDRHMVIRLKNIFPHAQVLISTNGTIIAFEEFVTKGSSPSLPLLSLNIDEAIFGGAVMSNPDDNMNFCFPVEIGHSIIDYKGERCSCGNRGCLETLCTTTRLFRMLNEKAGMKLEYLELFGAECNVEAMKQVAEELKNGSKAVHRVLQNYTEILCYGLMSTINLLGIRSVHIGGDIAILGDPFLKMIKENFDSAYPPHMSNQKISFELFYSDYEQVRRAATLMCLDIIFNK